MKFQAVSEAIYARLSGYTALTDQVVSIGYEHPQDATPEGLSAFPYVVIEDVSQSAWDTKTSNGGNQLVQVTPYARPSASKSAVAIANEVGQAVYDALHKHDLSVSGADLVNCLFEESPGNIPDPDGITRYKPLTFRVVYDDEL